MTSRPIFLRRCLTPRTLAFTAALACFVSSPAIAIVGIQGTMSNFDVFNETGIDVYGAELELEGVHPNEVSKTYPSHFNSMTMTEYTNGATFGTKIVFDGYNFGPGGFIIPTVGQNTNGHFCVNLPGCEHFGFSVSKQPTATRFYWTNAARQRIGTLPLSIPPATWTYQPPAVPGNPPVVAAAVQAPEPVEFQPMLPDSVWMKVYVTELDREVDLNELISGGDVAPQLPGEIEREWVLLEGGLQEVIDAPAGPNAKSVLRRFEYFKYSGPYDPTDHAPLSSYSGSGEPPAEELGEFISANMVAAILANCPSDFNNDAVVDDSDFVIFVKSYDILACSDPTMPPDCPGDINQDGQVDDADFSIFVVAYNNLLCP